MPNLPTASQLHLGNLLTAWFGLFVRKEVPAQDTARLEALCDRAMHNPALLTRMKAFQAQPAYKPGKELDGIWRTDYRSQGELIRSLNIKLDR